MATIRKRDDLGGKFEVSYYDVDGKRYRINTETTDEKTAEAWRKKAEQLVSLAKLGAIEKVGRITREVVAGEAVPETQKRLRLDAFEEEYLDRARHDLDLAERTLNIHTTAFKSFRNFVGNPYIDSITADNVRKWKRLLAAAGRSKATGAIYHRMMKAAFNRAVKWKMIANNPFVEVEIGGKRGALSTKKSMTIDEVRKLLSVIEERPFFRYVQFVLYTACRRNEILYLKREDLDLDKRIIYIKAQKTSRKLALPINKALLRVICDMQKNGELPESGYIFPTDHPRTRKQNQKPWHEHTPTHWFKKYVRKAGLDDSYSLHSTRHTYATYLESKGVPREITMQLLGHTSPSTTSGYVHTSALYFREYADQVDFEEDADGGEREV